VKVFTIFFCLIFGWSLQAEEHAENESLKRFHSALMKWETNIPGDDLIASGKMVQISSQKELQVFMYDIGTAIRFLPEIDSRNEIWYFYDKESLCKILLGEDAITSPLFRDYFSDNRSHVIRIVSSFLVQMSTRRTIHPNLPVPLRNVMPPGGGIAGQDPSSIQDANKRALYIEAIKQNERALVESSVQQYLKKSEESSFWPIFNAFIHLYSMEPFSPEEVKEYLSLWGLPDKVRDDVLNSLRENTKEGISWP
jgi:hypothetical protein